MSERTGPMTTLPAPRTLTRYALLTYALAVLVLILDQLSKAWILYGLHLADLGMVPILPFFRLSLVWNRGFSFGLLSQVDLARWGLSIFSVGVAIALALWARRTTRVLPALGLGLIIGGAVGNAADRVRMGAVVDFLDFTGTHVFPWVFNVADSGITVGVILLLLDSLLAKPEARP